MLCRVIGDLLLSNLYRKVQIEHAVVDPTEYLLD